MVKGMGLEVESDDVHELMKSHKVELNMKEQQRLQEEEKTLADDLSSDEDGGKGVFRVP